MLQLHPTYQFTFTSEQAQTMWACIMQAPLPRALTDDLALAFRSQIEAQNKQREEAATAAAAAAAAEKAAKANGHDKESTAP